MLKGKKILLGVTGSIAAYKVAILIRLLKKQEAEVKVITTSSASAFIGNITLATLSKNKVLSEFVTDKGNDWNNHVELGLWADLMIIYPSTANTLAKMVNGICDNLLLATYLSCKSPVWFAPAMDLDMYLHPSTQNNILKLQSFGNKLIEPQDGELASGLIGKGRVEEPEVVASLVSDFFESKNNQKFNKAKSLIGLKVVITAGPTYESLDPVRFIGNHSTGKMGYAIAEACYQNGAEVTLISGPSKLTCRPEIKRIDVTKAEEMFNASVKYAEDYDVAILSAAVADYTPEDVSDIKIKKSEDSFTIKLKKTKDILKYLGSIKKSNQTLVGFAMETNNVIENAKNKLINKNADMIVVNSLIDKGAGFGFDTNKVNFITHDEIKDFPLLTKQQVAINIVDYIAMMRTKKK